MSDTQWLVRKFLEDQDRIHLDLLDERPHIWETRLKLVGEMVQHEVHGDDLGLLGVLAMAKRTGEMCWAFLDTDLDKRKAAIEAWQASRRAYVEVVKAEFGL
jgi:hypothetical protein